jgi:hypothetical protein
LSIADDNSDKESIPSATFNDSLNEDQSMITPGPGREEVEEEEEGEEDREEGNPDISDAEAERRVRQRIQKKGRQTNHAAENAIIEEITCTNFMCHAHLSISIGPLINFIIGHNGSGKSAVLTALTLCLGGKATATNRGQSLKSFIKEGKE